jgi:hypothetical protein
MGLPCNQVMKHQHILSFLCLLLDNSLPTSVQASVFFIVVCYLPTDLHDQHIPEVDVLPPFNYSPTWFSWTSLMAHSRAKLIIIGDKETSLFQTTLSKKHIRQIFTYTDFTTGFI